MKKIKVGIGDIKVSGDEKASIKTYALGSCVAVIIYDAVSRIAGMIHIALPDSDVNASKAENLPGYFADTGLPLLFKEMNKLGAKRHNSWIKMVGGASVIKECESFDIGRRNSLAVKKLLWNKRLSIKKEDVGGDFSRTVSIDVTDGHILISNAGKKWEI